MKLLALFIIGASWAFSSLAADKSRGCSSAFSEDKAPSASAAKKTAASSKNSAQREKERASDSDVYQGENRALLSESIKELDSELAVKDRIPDVSEFDLSWLNFIVSQTASPKVSERSLARKTQKEIKALTKNSPFERYTKRDFLNLVRDGELAVSADGYILITAQGAEALYQRAAEEALSLQKRVSSIFYIPGKNRQETAVYLLGIKNQLKAGAEFIEVTERTFIFREDLFLQFGSSAFDTEAKKQALTTLGHIILKSYFDHLSYPMEIDFLRISGIDKNSFDKFLSHILGYRNYREFILDIAPFFEQARQRNRKKLLEAYINAINQNQKEEETARRHPQLPDIANELDKAGFIDISVKLVGRLLNLESSSFHEQLFNGWSGIKDHAKALKPDMFKNFIDDKIYYEQAQEFAAVIRKNNSGFIITSATSGVHLNDSFFNVLLKISREKGIPLAVIAVNGEAERLPYVKEVKKEDGSTVYQSIPWFEIQRRMAKAQKAGESLERDPAEEDAAAAEGSNPLEGYKPLHEIEDVYVIVYKIEASEFLVLNAAPIMPKNFSPFASFNKLLPFTEGKISIFGHPQMQLKIERSGQNHISPTEYAATGSISSNVYPARTNVQKRLSEVAKSVHQAGAWLVRPADKDGGVNGLPAPGMYSLLPLREGKLKHKSGEEYTGVISDDSTFYGKAGERFSVEPEYLVPGDLHVGSSNPKMFKIIAETLEKHPNLNIVLHDSFDGYSINHHEASRVMSNSQKAQKGLLSLEAEYRRNVEVINSFLELTKGRIIFVASNHPNWLTQVLNSKEAYSDPLNSEFLTEIRHAVELNGLDPWEYLYQERERYHKNNPNLDVRMALAEENIYVNDPSRVVVLKPGEPFYAGDIRLDVHSHSISGGRGGGITPTNAPNLGNAIVGHSHNPAMLAEVIDVGTSTRERLSYTQESALSNWMNGFALVYPFSSGRLFVIHPLLERAEPEGRPLSPEQHFGEDYPKIIQSEGDFPNMSMTSVHDSYKTPKNKGKKSGGGD